MSKVTIREVAAEAGVGIGTVSRVLNNSKHVSDDTRQRVLQVMHDLGFKPNAIARQLPRKTTLQTIGVLTRPFTEYYSFSERLRGVRKAIQPYEDEFDLALYNTPNTKEYQERLSSIIDNGILAGVLILDLRLMPEQKETLNQFGIPYFAVNHFKEDDPHSIGTDNEEGGYIAAKHLLELGHRKIAYVGNELTDDDGFITSGQRYNGMCRALQEYGITPHADYLCVDEMGFEPARRMAMRLLQLPDRPTAIFTMSDTQAFACMRAARDLGLTVPHDISIIGYDDIEMSDYVELTTVRQHLEASGEIAMRHLLKMVHGATPPTPTLPKLDIVVRKTTASPPDTV